VAGTLRVIRESFGIELQRGAFDVVVDGRNVGTIEKKNDSLETSLEPGHHTVRIRKGRYSSAERSFYAVEGESASFRCHGASVWPRWVASRIVPSIAISLTPQ
jgi:hypothetical protein